MNRRFSRVLLMLGVVAALGVTAVYLLKPRTTTPETIVPTAAAEFAATAVSLPTPAPFVVFVEQRQYQLPHGVINRAAISPEAGLIAAAFRDGGLGLYDLATFAETDFIPLDEPTAAVVFSPDGSRLAVGLNEEMRLWSVENKRLQSNPVIFPDMGSWVDAIVFSADGSLLAVGVYPQSARIWQMADNALVAEIDNGRTGKSVAFSPDGGLLAVGDTTGQIQVWDVANGRLLQTLGEADKTLGSHIWGITALAFSPDGAQIVATSADNYDTAVWDIATGTLLQTLHEDSNFVKGYHFSPAGKWLMTLRADAKLWEPLTGTLLQTLENPGTFLAAGAFIAPHKIITLNVQGLIREWEEE